MGYPIYNNKHIEKSLFSAQDYVSWKNFLKNDKTKRPTKFIIIYYPRILNYFKKKYNTKKLKLYRLLTVYQHKDIGIVMMTGIGSPNAVTVFEELIALGGKEFINMGAAGGLNTFGVFLCDKAIRDEGTSSHYIKHEKFSYPDENLTKKLGISMEKMGLNYVKGTTWTIDAPYRETKAEIEHYKKIDVKTVEMEASALFTVAKVRRVKIASAFVVTDILGEEKWDPQFDSKHVNQMLNKLVDAAADCLTSKTKTKKLFPNI